MNDKNIEEIVIYPAYIDADPSKFLVNKPLIIKEPDVFYKGIKLKKTGEFGQEIEYTDGNGGKYQKHKFKPGAEVVKII